jgi:ATP-dependent DNA helicase Rep
VSQLNPRQREAVKYIDGPLLVLAGAGSGKTSVITRKIAYLIEQCGIEARHIAAVTFTNKAAREMKERVGQLVSGAAAKGLTVSTFHNLGLNIIRFEHRALGFKPGFSIFDETDTATLVKELLLNDAIDPDQLDLIRNQISNWKNAMTLPADAIHLAQSNGEMKIARVYEQYQDALRAYNAVDFDDLILLPVQLFRDNADVLDRWRNRIRYLLVDEYQDTNNSQYELVKLVIGDRNGLTVVGDDDQSIYAWRGANPQNLAQLQADFPTLKVVKLEQNYRSTARILKAANTLIANNPHVFEKSLWSELGHGDPIRLIRCRNEDHEAERVVTEIVDQRLQKRTQFRDYAILYRGNHQSRLLEMKLQQHQIKDVMAYLRLLINPDDDNALLRIINVPRRKIGPTSLQALGHYANSRHISLYQAAGEIGAGQHLNEASLERIREFTRWMDNLARRIESEDAIDCIREMLSDIDYEGWLHQNSSSAAVAEKRMGNVWYLVDSLKKMLQRDDESDEEITIKDAIARLVLRDLLERQDEAGDGDKVQLLTLHASKGLEYPHVFIIGCEEDLLPHRNSIETDNIEEERRLAYVGITRAQRTLTLTFAAKRRQFGENTDTTISRFIDELPAEDIVREGFGDDAPEANVKRGRDTLSGLKNLFD